MVVEANLVLEDLELGHSLSTNGVCLTVTQIKEKEFTADVMRETLSRSSLGGLRVGSYLNLERALAVDARFGGHIVTGHIDGVGTITSIRKEGIAVWYTIKTFPEISRYIVEKGSIAIDGISLTVATVNKDSFSVSIIPHTIDVTNLSHATIGTVVNLETDIIGKYVEKLISPSQGITKNFLLEKGF